MTSSTKPNTNLSISAGEPTPSGKDSNLAPATTPSMVATDHVPVSPNPWSDPTPPATAHTSTEKLKPEPLATLDPSIDEQSAFAGPKEPSEPGSAAAVSREVLSEFDPLVSYEEKAARDAWGASEGHPPPPKTPSPPATPPQPPVKDLYLSSPMSPAGPNPIDSVSSTPAPIALASPPVGGVSSSSFPSFASLARSFALPLARSRPQSIDASARAVPSPATLSSFATQQEQQPQQQVDDAGKRADTGKAIASGEVDPPNQSQSGSASPGPKHADGGFDFQKFLDQMKTKSADPVSKYLRSFLSNFAKRTFTVNDQVKIINDFLVFIAAQMRECDVWKNCSDTDFENALEGMEKLVMNRLYDFTFTPQLALATPPRPITTDDLERDRVLSQRIALFGWLEEKHLDVPEGEGSKGFLMFAEQELLKINHYKAPRDKLICILNCCKVIFGLIRHLHKEEGADSFVPILIFVVLKANPEHLLSNVEFINRFRNPEKLQSEAGYYLSSLMGAVSFIESMDHTSLSSITQEEFEKNVEEAIQALPPSEPQSPNIAFADAKVRGIIPLAPASTHPQSPHAGEESALPLSLSAPPPTQVSLSDDAKRLLQRTGDTISKPLNAIGRIFTEALDGAENKLSYLPGPFAPFELGREGRGEASSMHSAAPSSAGSGTGTWEHGQPPQTPHGPGGASYNNVPVIHTPYKPRVRRGHSPSTFGFPSPGASPGYGPEETPSRGMGPYTNQPLAMGPSVQQQYPYASANNALVPPRVSSLTGGGGSGYDSDGAHISRTPTPALDFAGVQREIDSAHEQAEAASRETLRQIFPTVDIEIVEWVLEANDGDLGKSIEQLLDISGD